MEAEDGRRTQRTILMEPLRCLECGRSWVELSERWRTYLDCEDPPQPLTYCPDCARREFD
jgi:hypothetical protein